MRVTCDTTGEILDCEKVLRFLRLPIETQQFRLLLSGEDYLIAVSSSALNLLDLNLLD